MWLCCFCCSAHFSPVLLKNLSGFMIISKMTFLWQKAEVLLPEPSRKMFLLEFSVSAFTAALCFCLCLVWHLISIRGISVPGLTRMWRCPGQRLALSHLCAATPDGSSSPELLWELGGFREFVPAAGENLRALWWELCLRNELKTIKQEWFRLFHSW